MPARIVSRRISNAFPPGCCPLPAVLAAPALVLLAAFALILLDAFALIFLGLLAALALIFRLWLTAFLVLVLRSRTMLLLVCLFVTHCDTPYESDGEIPRCCVAKLSATL